MTVVVARSLDEAIEAARALPGAHLLAGGTDLMVEVNEGHRRPSDIIAIGRVPELAGWRYDPAAETLTLGAALTYTEMLEPPLAELAPSLAEAARTVGSPQIRNAGTLGGNLATASPAGDALPVLAALDAVVELTGPAGGRRVAIGEFFTGVKATVLVPGELVVSTTVPVVGGWQGFAKVGVRNAMVIAIASACLVVDRARPSVQIALGAVGPTVLRCPEAEAWLTSRIEWGSAGLLSAGVADEFGRRVAAEARPIDDHRSTADYRRHAVAILARRLLERSVAS